MKRMTINAMIVMAIAFACWACGSKGAVYVSNSQSNSTPNASGDLHFKAPDAWVTEKPSSSTRVGQYKLPKAEGDNEDASLVLYYFGAAQGGAVQANIDRWIGQMQQPDGSASKDKAKTENLTVNGLKVTTVDLTGTFTAEMMPGSGDRHNNADYRLRGAVVETPKGSYFAKLVGPSKTVARWDQAYSEYLKSFEFK
jgi:predicted small lipoprotein YifL